MRGRFPPESSSLSECNTRSGLGGRCCPMSGGCNMGWNRSLLSELIFWREKNIRASDLLTWSAFLWLIESAGKMTQFCSEVLPNRAKQTPPPPMTGRDTNSQYSRITLKKKKKTYTQTERGREMQHISSRRSHLLLEVWKNRGNQGVKTAAFAAATTDQPRDTSGAPLDGHVVPRTSPLKWKKSFDKRENPETVREQLKVQRNRPLRRPLPPQRHHGHCHAGKGADFYSIFSNRKKKIITGPTSWSRSAVCVRTFVSFA